MSCLNMRGVDENVTFQHIDDIKIIITSKFKEKLWFDENLEDKRKLRYFFCKTRVEYLYHQNSSYSFWGHWSTNMKA